MLIDQEQARILDSVQSLQRQQMIDIRHPLGRVLAKGVISSINVPAYNNSAMDGYAVASSDLTGDADHKLEVIGNVPPGHPFQGPIAPGPRVKTMTGAANA
jgi:molybdopterin molybdotransferase